MRFSAFGINFWNADLTSSKHPEPEQPDTTSRALHEPPKATFSLTSRAYARVPEYNDITRIPLTGTRSETGTLFTTLSDDKGYRSAMLREWLERSGFVVSELDQGGFMVRCKSRHDRDGR